MPLRGKLWKEAGEVIFAGTHPFAGADGAAGVLDCPGARRRLPFVPLGAAPPDLPLAAVCDVRRGQRSVQMLVPLREQLVTSCFQAEVQ